jgi:thiol:disulfide interchange protein DsbD
MKKIGPVQMELVFEQQGIIPGEEFWIGWRIVREKGWHTYWKHPGDVGVPPSIKWELPPGFATEELLYSLPQKVKMASIRANGNYGETLFLTKAQAPSDLEIGALITVKAKASWLACSRQCKPGFADLSAEVEVVQEEVFDSALQSKFEEFRKLIPGPIGDDWKVSASNQGRYIELVLQPKNPSLGKEQERPVFFCSNRLVRSDGIQFLTRDQGSLKLRLERSDWAEKEEKFLTGLVYRKNGWGGEVETEYFSIQVPLVATNK